VRIDDKNFTLPEDDLMVIEHSNKIDISCLKMGQDFESSVIPNTEDSIVDIPLIHPYMQDVFFVNSGKLNEFNFVEVDELGFESTLFPIDFVLRVPTRPPLLRNNKISMYVKILNKQDLRSENILAKFISPDFWFDQSLVKLDENEEQSIVLTKKHSNESYQIQLKVYIDNTISLNKEIDLWNR
jgi:hypothetical protein